LHGPFATKRLGKEGYLLPLTTFSA
jgi:hypothetical protein